METIMENELDTRVGLMELNLFTIILYEYIVRDMVVSRNRQAPI